jgi:hypothetical protein
MKDIPGGDDLDKRVADSVRRALRLVGQAENGVERDVAESPEETRVS